MSRLRQFAIAAVLGTGLFGVPAPVLAQGEDQIVVQGRRMPSGYGAVQQIVRIGDLDLTSRPGVAEMEKRVRSTIHLMCRVVPPSSAAKQRESKTCREFAWAGARPQMARAVELATEITRR